MTKEKENDIQIMMVQLLFNKKPQSPTADQLRKALEKVLLFISIFNYIIININI